MLNNVQFIVGLDPSFTRTGICVIDLIKKEISFFTASCKIGEKQFENVVHAAQSVVKQIKDIINDNCCVDKCAIVMESPLPNSSMSAALYCLDSLLYTEFESHVVKTYNPATLRSRIHGHKYDKTDSVNLANKYLKILTDHGYIINLKIGKARKIAHDCCEAFLYIHLYLHDNGNADFQFDNADEIAAFKLRQKELKRREKLLLSDKGDLA
jgi:hypothetical protein